MDFKTQLKPGADQKIRDAIADATLDDLISEIKARCTCVGIIMVVEDDDGEDQILTASQGPSLSMLGAIEELKHNLLNRPRGVVDDEEEEETAS